MMDSAPYLLSVAAAGIAVLLVLVIKVRLEPFVSLLLVSALVALAAGIPLAEIVPDMEAGMGKVLAHVAPIVGLGAMLGKMLELSGGAQQIADRLLRLFGEKRAPGRDHHPQLPVPCRIPGHLHHPRELIPMYHEILSSQQAAEVAAWWRQAFQALQEPVSGAAEREASRSR